MRGDQRAKRLSVWLAIGATWVGVLGCRPAAPETADMQVEWSLTPSPPVVGDAELSLELANAERGPLQGAQVEVEGNMNHAGMKPSWATLREVEPGSYQGTIRFTMAGDWFLLVNARTPDGQLATHKIDVRGVKSQ